MKHNVINDFVISIPSYVGSSHKIYVNARNNLESFQFAMVICDGKWRIRNASTLPVNIKELEIELNKMILEDFGKH